MIKQMPYLIAPRIHEIMQKMTGYTHFTNMDLNMLQYYYFELDERSKIYTTIITPDSQIDDYS